MPYPSRTAVVAACLALWPVLAFAQPTPVGPEIQVNVYSKGLQAVGGIASDAQGDFVVAWESGAYPSLEPQDGSGAGIFIRRFEADGTPLGGDVQVNVFTPGDQRSPAVDRSPDGDFVVVWWSFGQDGEDRSTVYGRRFNTDGTPKGGEFRLGTSPGFEIVPSVGVCPDGGFVAAWQNESQVFARWFDPSGAPRGEEVQVSSGGYPENQFAEVDCDAEGRAVVVWESCCGNAGDLADIRARLYGPDSSPLGDEFAVETEPGRSFTPSVAFGPDGGFVVAWDTYIQVWARRFLRDGTPSTPPWKVSSPTNAFQGGTDVLLDKAGNLLVTWSVSQRDLDPYDVYGKWYGSSGAEQGGSFRLNTTTEHDQAAAVLAPLPSGFVAAWLSGLYNGPGQDGDQWGVIARRFAYPPRGADPCRFGPEGLSCDVHHDGGGAEIAIPFGQPGDVPLLGNLDGDSRDDLCTWRAGRFRCDLAHDGGAAELEIAFGAAGDVPLLGDVNGDGRDDACVRRGRRFACDTAHNGGTAEVQIVFGQFKDIPLLGDVDGDGDDDPCLFRRDRFMCDTVHDGRSAEVVVRFGQAGDVPLLGDVDADGDDDFCVFRQDRFLCGTVEILFGDAGVPVLGNVNGI